MGFGISVCLGWGWEEIWAQQSRSRSPRAGGRAQRSLRVPPSWDLGSSEGPSPAWGASCVEPTCARTSAARRAQALPSPGPQPYQLGLAPGSRRWLHAWSLTPKGQHRVPGKVLGLTAQRGFLTEVRVCLHPPTDTQHRSWQSICSPGASTASLGSKQRSQELRLFQPSSQQRRRLCLHP